MKNLFASALMVALIVFTGCGGANSPTAPETVPPSSVGPNVTARILSFTLNGVRLTAPTNPTGPNGVPEYVFYVDRGPSYDFRFEYFNPRAAGRKIDSDAWGDGQTFSFDEPVHPETITGEGRKGLGSVEAERRTKFRASEYGGNLGSTIIRFDADIVLKPKS